MEKRESDGLELFKQGLVQEKDGIFQITGRDFHTSIETCDCPDHMFRKITCKHMWAVKFFLDNKAESVPDIKKLMDFVKGKDFILESELDKLFPFNVIEEALSLNRLIKSGKYLIERN